MKYLLLSIPLFLLFSNAWADVFIQNDQQYIAEDGTLHIVGEIQNDLGVPLNQIDVIVTLYSNNYEIIDILETNSLVNTIMPEMKAPFDLAVFGNNAKLVHDYSIDLDYKVAAPKSQSIDITSSDLSSDNFDNLMITGTVINKGEITANIISVVATVYDENGNVAGVSRTHTEPDFLRTNDEVFFLVSLPDKIQNGQVVDYSIVAESEEYAPVPEFPLGSGILLASSVGAYVLITRIPNRFMANLVSAYDLK